MARIKTPKAYGIPLHGLLGDLGSVAHRGLLKLDLVHFYLNSWLLIRAFS